MSCAIGARNFALVEKATATFINDGRFSRKKHIQ